MDEGAKQVKGMVPEVRKESVGIQPIWKCNMHRKSLQIGANGGVKSRIDCLLSNSVTNQ